MWPRLLDNHTHPTRIFDPQFRSFIPLYTWKYEPLKQSSYLFILIQFSTHTSALGNDNFHMGAILNLKNCMDLPWVWPICVYICLHIYATIAVWWPWTCTPWHTNECEPSGSYIRALVHVPTRSWLVITHSLLNLIKTILLIHNYNSYNLYRRNQNWGDRGRSLQSM